MTATLLSLLMTSLTASSTAGRSASKKVVSSSSNNTCVPYLELSAPVQQARQKQQSTERVSRDHSTVCWALYPCVQP
jgi:hypothetical protein